MTDKTTNDTAATANQTPSAVAYDSHGELQESGTSAGLPQQQQLKHINDNNPPTDTEALACHDGHRSSVERGYATTRVPPVIDAGEPGGPATYLGGAPFPVPVGEKPTPDVISEARAAEAVRRAEFDHEEAEKEREETLRQHDRRDAQWATTMRAAETKHAAQVAEKRHAATGTELREAAATCQQRLEAYFPDHNPTDRAVAMFDCKYVDGSARATGGHLIITNDDILFASDAAPCGCSKPLRVEVPYKQVASVDGFCTPGVIKVYTVDGKVYIFSEIDVVQKCIEDDTSQAAAVNWIDHLWRERTPVPNPAATYFTS